MCLCVRPSPPWQRRLEHHRVLSAQQRGAGGGERERRGGVSIATAPFAIKKHEAPGGCSTTSLVMSSPQHSGA